MCAYLLAAIILGKGRRSIKNRVAVTCVSEVGPFSFLFFTLLSSSKQISIRRPYYWIHILYLAASTTIAVSGRVNAGEGLKGHKHKTKGGVKKVSQNPSRNDKQTELDYLDRQTKSSFSSFSLLYALLLRKVIDGHTEEIRRCPGQGGLNRGLWWTPSFCPVLGQAFCG